MVIHDDWPRTAGFRGAAAWWLDREFSRAYREAASRLCVSPYMAQPYFRRYEVSGFVLYPARAPGAKVFSAPSKHLHDAVRPLVAGFAGSVNSMACAVALRAIGKILAESGGHLEIFGSLTQEDAARADLRGSGIRLNGSVKADKIVQVMRCRVDLLFTSMSFAADDADNARLGFPCKLTDYTPCGLPILIYGPKNCSAMQWTRATQQVACVATEHTACASREAARTLQFNCLPRLRLATRAMNLGAREFSPEAAEGMWLGAVRAPLAQKN